MKRTRRTVMRKAIGERLPDAITIEVECKRVVSFRVERELAKAIEEAVREEGFTSRSHFIRSVLNRLLSGHLRLDHSGLPTRCDVTLTIRLEESFLEKLDELVKKEGFGNRSDLIRAALYCYLRDRRRTEAPATPPSP